MPTIKQNGYEPIFVGNKVRQQKMKDGEIDEESVRKYMTGAVTDDAYDGENISDLNRFVNEMTAVYWLWKHYDKIGNPEFIGLSHYRRFFAFNEHIPLAGCTWLPHSSTIIYDRLANVADHISVNYAKKLFDKGYSILTTRQYDAALLGNGDRSCRERFGHISNWDIGLYDIMESLVLKTNPDYAPEIQALRDHGSHYLFNMFVMKRGLFFAYCEFIFPILLELQKHVPASEDAAMLRAPGFLAEFLTSMFISHQLRCNKTAVKELNTIYISNPENLPPPAQPQQKKQNYFKASRDLPGRQLRTAQLIYLLFRKLNPRHWFTL